MSYEATFVTIGSMRIGHGIWGVIFQDGLHQLQKHRVSYLTRPQEEEHYGDKDVLHEQIIVEDRIDPASAPLGFVTTFDRTEERMINHSLGLYRWWSDGRLFVYAVETIEGQTPTGNPGCTYPSGGVRGIVEAYRVRGDENSLYFDILTWEYHGYEPVLDSGGNVVEMIPASLIYDEAYYTKANTLTLFENGQWCVGPDWYTRGTVLEPVIPYRWREWMWSHHPTIPETDYTAKSECYRNAVSRITQSGMNNIQNVLECVDTIKTIRNKGVLALFDSFKRILDGDQAKIVKHKVHDPSKGVSKTVKYVKWDSKLKRYVDFGQDAWLKYRYVYGTTKSDVESAVDYFINEKWKTLEDRQVVRGSIGISDGQMRLKMRLREKRDLAYMLRTDFKSVGLFPDLTTLWDMLPGSFIVDWFLPDFANELEDLDQKYLGAAYDVLEMLVTLKHEWDVESGGFVYHCKSYSRTFDYEPPQFEFYEESKKPKGTTVMKRALDVGSIFIK